MTEKYSDEEVVQSILLNINPEIIGWFYDEVRLIVFSMAVSYGITSIEDMEDITQDVNLAFCESIYAKKFKGVSKARSYVYAIARNKCFDRFRRQQEKLYDPTTEEPNFAGVDHSTPEYLVLLTERANLLSAYFSLLSPQCREIFNLKNAPEKLSNKEIAEKMNLGSVHYVATLLYRCRKQLALKILADPILLGRLMDSLYDSSFEMREPLVKYASDFDMIISYCKNIELPSKDQDKIEEWLNTDEDFGKLVEFLQKHLR